MGAVGSTLEAACDQYIGRTLVVEPHNGWGWVHQQGQPFAESQGVPPPSTCGACVSTPIKGNGGAS